MADDEAHEIDDEIDTAPADENADGIDDELDDELDDEDAPDDLDPISIDNPDPVATARRKFGAGGAILAAGMFGVDQALTGKQKPEFAEIQESSSQPVDLDKDGFHLAIDEARSVDAPALERRPPIGVNKKSKRR
ncbi:MAG: hypothetical protein JWM34_727 [Ilumatobacteraceae bacterium]|nr:hypothetical protein [Ilumatobacteraceae bacterium]